MRVSYEVAPNIGNTLSRQTADIDARYYQRLGATGLLALRARAFKSWGEAPDFMYFGGNSEMRGYEYLQFVGDNTAFFNAELRFPLIEAMLTPVGILGGIRGVFFANMGGAHFGGQPFKWWSSGSQVYTPIVGFRQLGGLQQEPIFGQPVVIDGLRLVDARASYGIGLETFALGFPIHFDYAWRTLFNKQWEDALFAAYGGSSAFRKPEFSIWIGYDF
jgi:outer membrane protein assembly factor BamA